MSFFLYILFFLNGTTFIDIFKSIIGSSKRNSIKKKTFLTVEQNIVEYEIIRIITRIPTSVPTHPPGIYSRHVETTLSWKRREVLSYEYPDS